MTDELVKLMPREVLVPEQFEVTYPGNDAWMQLDPSASAPSGDPAWLQIEKYAITGGGTPKAVSCFGQAQLDTAQFKFGASSALFDGAGDYMTSPDHDDWSFSAADFTIEGWVRFSDLTFDGILCGQWDSAASQMSWLLTWNGSNQWALASSLNGTANVGYNFSHTPSNGVWYHLALSRSSGSLRFFVDGVQIGTTQTLSGALFNSTAPLSIGGRADVTTVSLAGWIDELRISKGVARYTANFTPPSAPFTTDANTVLLLHMEGADASTTIADDSPAPATGVDPGSDPAWMEVEH